VNHVIKVILTDVWLCVLQFMELDYYFITLKKNSFNNNNNVHISILPWVITSEVVIGHVTRMSEIKKMSINLGSC